MQLLSVILMALILVVSTAPGLAQPRPGRGPTNIDPGTRFGRTPMANEPYPYLYPVNPELWRQKQRERDDIEAPPEEPPQEKAVEEEKPPPKKVRRAPKIIEVQ